MHVVIGLGNPGRTYDGTRHNAGFLVVDRLAARASESVSTAQYGALVGKARLGGHTVVLAKPQSFMNRSGQPAASLKGYYKADNAEVVVIHDDMDIPYGEVRVKSGGGHGGHNGLRDLNQKIGNDYVRVRFGVGRPPQGWDPADYVLGRWSGPQSDQLDQSVDTAADAVEAVLRDGVVSAMNVFNTRGGRNRDAAEPNPLSDK
ncbi:MAG: aminoacyl-tRNA hydrolase [Myxococcota bacterium]